MVGPSRRPGMPPTVVHAALAGLLAAGVVGRHLTSRSAAVVVAAGAVPDLDAALALVWPGSHGAVLHTLFVPAAAAALLYYDTGQRSASAVRRRWGARGVAVAWTAVLAYALAGVTLDLFNVDAAAALWPVDGRYYVVVGHLIYESQGGLTQSFVGFQLGWPPVLVETLGPDHFVQSPFDVRPGPDPPDAARVVDVVESGWQLFLTACGSVATVVAVRGEP